MIEYYNKFYGAASLICAAVHLASEQLRETSVFVCTCVLFGKSWLIAIRKMSFRNHIHTYTERKRIENQVENWNQYSPVTSKRLSWGSNVNGYRGAFSRIYHGVSPFGRNGALAFGPRASAFFRLSTYHWLHSIMRPCLVGGK